MQDFKSGFISITGRANVGKSTIINALVGEKVSIVTYHPQTTRNKILGIMNGDNYQIILIDTPGIHAAKNKLSQFMLESMKSALDGIDVMIYVVDVKSRLNNIDRDYLTKFSESEIPLIVVINKCDLVNQEQVMDKINEIVSLSDKIKNIIPLSAQNKTNIELLKNEILDKLKPGGVQYFDEDVYTDKSTIFMISEIIREKAMQKLQDEIPYGIAVEIDKYKKRKDGLIDVYASIICEKTQHKQIVIGKKGQMMQKIATAARFEIEKMLGTQIYLNIWVKVKENWRDSDNLIKLLGYDKKEI